MHGLPIVIKDLVSTAGIRTTFGSPIYADHVPDQDDLIVERLRAAGAIILGKSNVPEFGAGSHTFNPVFGATRNPYDLTRSCGGSSGGAAVALATGMVPIADGSDLGGSLRNPASFCNVVGFRPSPGRVPSWPTLDAWSPLAVLGPMARSVGDAALLLSAIAGPDARAPIAIAEPPDRFAAPLDADFRGTRVAWSRNLGPLPRRAGRHADHRRPASGVRSAGLRGRGRRARLPRRRRHLPDAARLGDLPRPHRRLRLHRDRMKDTVIWNTEQGLALSGMDVSEAVAKRTELYERVHEFMQRYDFLVLPAAAVPPFPIEQPWVREIDGVAMHTYIDWMAVCYAITLTGLPAISVPAGFTSEGLPIGVQIVGRHQADFEVLQLAHAFETATGVGRTRPSVAG